MYNRRHGRKGFIAVFRHYLHFTHVRVYQKHIFPWVFILKETLVAADLRKTLSKLIFLKVVCEDQPFSG